MDGGMGLPFRPEESQTMAGSPDAANNPARRAQRLAVLTMVAHAFRYP
jgi:hypothetical protein